MRGTTSQNMLFVNNIFITRIHNKNYCTGIRICYL